MEIDTLLGERIYHARVAAGLNQQELAERVGVKLSTVAKWEADRSSPRANRINQLAGVLGVPMAWLLAGPDQSASLPHPSLNETMRIEGKLEAAEALIDQLGDLLKDIRQQTKSIQKELDAELVD